MSATLSFDDSEPEMLETEYRKISLAILAVAAALRVIWAILIPVVPVSDGKAYDLLAHNLVQYGVYGWSAGQPSAFWPPGISAVYAAFYCAFGSSVAPIVVLNIALSTAIVGLTIWLGRIFFGETVALIAGALMAISPSEIGFVTIFASELPFTCLVLAGVAVWFGLRLSNFARAVVSGLAFGAATYFRSVALLLPIVLWLTSLPDWRKLRGQLPVVLIAMIVAGVVIAPWSVRNTKVFGHFVMLSTSEGVNLWMGNNPDANGYFMFLPSDAPKLGEYEQNKVFGGKAKEYIIAKPGAFLQRFVKKAFLLHAGETTSVTWNTDSIESRFGKSAVFPLKLLTQGFWTATLLFALGGIVILIRRRGVTQALTEPIVLIWIYFTVVYSVYFAADRYHFPSHPLISVLAAIAILASFRRVWSMPRAGQHL
jgi:4-amino-4-deoxy-L-arabinose transferase-like glycosyltransferase